MSPTGTISQVSVVPRSLPSAIHRLEKSQPLSAAARMLRHSASAASPDRFSVSSRSSRYDSGRGRASRDV